MTLDDQRREQNRGLDRGKKLIAGCLLGAAFVLYQWNALPGFFSFAAACVLLAGAVAAQLRQIPLAPPLRLLLTLVLGVSGAYFAARGVLETLLTH